DRHRINQDVGSLVELRQGAHHDQGPASHVQSKVTRSGRESNVRQLDVREVRAHRTRRRWIATLQGALSNVRSRTGSRTLFTELPGEPPAKEPAQRMAHRPGSEDVMRIADDFDSIGPRPGQQTQDLSADVARNASQDSSRLDE